MTIYQRIAAVYAAAGVPGFLQDWFATPEHPTIPDKYLTYRVEWEGEALSADDAEAVHRYTVWIDLFGRTDVSGEQAALLRQLRGAGFYIPYTRDMDNLRLTDHPYHRRLQVTYYEFNHEED